MAPKPKSDAENKEERRCEAAALEIVNKGGNVGKDLRRKDKVLITIPRRRRVFQDGIGRWNDILSEHLGFSQKLEKGVPSNDASLSMRRTLREAGVKVPGVAKKKTDPYGIDRPEHFHPPVAVTAPLDKKKDNKKEGSAPLAEAGHKEEGWHVAGLKPRELQLFYDLFEDMLGATHAHVTGISAAGKDEEEEKRKRAKALEHIRMVVDDHDEALARFGLVGRYEPDERGQYTDMPDPSKSPQFLDDCLHRSDFEAYLRVRVAAIEKDEDKLYRILGGWRPARVHRVIGNAYCDVVLENEDGDGTLITHLHHLQIRKKHVGDVFDLMDRDGDGRLTADEARANLTGDGSGHRTFALDEHVDVQVDGHLPELWGRVARRLGIGGEFMAYSDFLGMHVSLAGATEPKNKALMSTMDPEFFLESYPWWGPIFERFGIGRGGQTSMLSGLLGGGDGSGACDSGCSVS